MTRKVLIVEDEPQNQFLFETLMEAFGYDYVTTDDGRDVVALSRSHKPNLILIDIQLPHISGLDVVAQVRADNDLKDTPIIAVTAFAMRGDAQRILEAGCDAYMSKPISIEPFRNTIDALLNGDTAVPEPPKPHPFTVNVARQ